MLLPIEKVFHKASLEFFVTGKTNTASRKHEALAAFARTRILSPDNPP